jgi:hypothetical protein
MLSDTNLHMKRKNTTGAPVNGADGVTPTEGAWRREPGSGAMSRPSFTGKCRSRSIRRGARRAADRRRPTARDLELARDIMRAVPHRFHLDALAILSRNRALRVAEARKLAMFLVVELTGLHYQRIGQLFHRDHSTIFYARDRVRIRMAAQPLYRRHIETLLASFGQGSNPTRASAT